MKSRMKIKNGSKRKRRRRRMMGGGFAVLELDGERG
jgi:hypothetical protein